MLQIIVTIIISSLLIILGIADAKIKNIKVEGNLPDNQMLNQL